MSRYRWSRNPRARGCGSVAEGDLRVEGWEQALIEATVEEGQPVVEAGPNQLEIEAASSLVVRLPFASEIVESAAGGDRLR